MWRLALLFLWSTVVPGARLAPTPLAHAAYVWQRAHGDEVDDAVQAAPRELGALVWLAAELDARARPPLSRVPLAAARASGRPAGLALRAHTLPDTAFASPTAPRELVDALTDTLARAREAGLSPTELQLDFDCPTRHLAAYARWVGELRGASGDVPLTITALPAWLDARAFGALARATDGFVLQVHSLSLPRTRGEAASLFDERAARRAVIRAADHGVSFRVALPTHGYGVTFDEAGRLASVVGEQTGDAPEDVMADPVAVASFVRWLGRARPPEVSGAVWFRLPTSVDRRSTSMHGLALLLRGETPRALVVTRATRDDDGAWAISITNEGDAPAQAPRARAVFRQGALDTYDATGATASVGEGEIGFATAALAPHATRQLGWIRLTGDDERIDVDAR